MSRGPNPNLRKTDISKAPFLFMQADPKDYYNVANNAVKNDDQDANILSTVFFSPQNIELIQKQIIKTVLLKTDKKYLIEPQNRQDLLVVMRSIFIQYAQHLPNNIKEQIRELNKIVVDEVVPGIVDNILLQIGYLKKISEPMQMIDRPINSSKSRSLPSYMN